MSDILWTEAGRLAADISEIFGAVCELRERSSGELRERLIVAAAALSDAHEEAKSVRDHEVSKAQDWLGCNRL